MKKYKIDELIEGVEYESEGNKYKIEGNQLFVLSIWDDSSWVYSLSSYNKTLKMKFTECEFNPKEREEYWHPCFIDEEGVSTERWYDETEDHNIKKNVGVYRTKERAIEKARELGWI